MPPVQIEANFPVTIFREGKDFIAYTPALDLSTVGKTHAEVRERFQEAVTLFLEELIKHGTLDDVLTSLGWKQHQKKWSPPVFVSHEVRTLRIPA